MSVTINIYYTGINGSARRFVEEMEGSGIASAVRAEEGNEGYSYFYSANDCETVLLVDRWKNQAALDFHHKSPMMKQIAKIRTKYKLKMMVEKFVDAD